MPTQQRRKTLWNKAELRPGLRPQDPAGREQKVTSSTQFVAWPNRFQHLLESSKNGFRLPLHVDLDEIDAPTVLPFNNLLPCRALHCSKDPTCAPLSVPGNDLAVLVPWAAKHRQAALSDNARRKRVPISSRFRTRSGHACNITVLNL